MAGIRATLELEIPGVGVLRLPWHGVTMDPTCSGGASWDGNDSETALSDPIGTATDGSTKSGLTARGRGAAAVRAALAQRQTPKSKARQTNLSRRECGR